MEAERDFPKLKAKIEGIAKGLKENLAKGRFDYLASLEEMFRLVHKWESDDMLDERLQDVPRTKERTVSVSWSGLVLTGMPKRLAVGPLCSKKHSAKKLNQKNSWNLQELRLLTGQKFERRMHGAPAEWAARRARLSPKMTNVMQETDHVIFQRDKNSKGGLSGARRALVRFPGGPESEGPQPWRQEPT
jgi:hypothetical protein